MLDGGPVILRHDVFVLLAIRVKSEVMRVYGGVMNVPSGMNELLFVSESPRLTAELLVRVVGETLGSALISFN